MFVVVVKPLFAAIEPLPEKLQVISQKGQFLLRLAQLVLAALQLLLLDKELLLALLNACLILRKALLSFGEPLFVLLLIGSDLPLRLLRAQQVIFERLEPIFLIPKPTLPGSKLVVGLMGERMLAGYLTGEMLYLIRNLLFEGVELDTLFGQALFDMPAQRCPRIDSARL